MSKGFTIRRATASDAREVAEMVGELLTEIMDAIGIQAFNFDLAETTARLADFVDREKYYVFLACGESGQPVGFIALYESYALYAEGAFGTISELYVRRECRSGGLGLRLVFEARAFGVSRGWRRLEVTTPPLPEFERTLAFYECLGFSVTGGRKLKLSLQAT
jgi:GNAT superfamily N-acetyltransferase